MSGEAEPRRSVRATKGQHTKSFDDQQIEPPKKRGRKKKQEQEEPEEEIIRCVCGATEQDGDSEEPWIACDTCGAWQHNVCMGMSVFTEDLPKHYYCEQCAPQDHKELLEAIDRGDKPWEERRKAYEEEQADKKKKKKKGGRGGKRVSDPKEELSQTPNPKAEDTPAPEPSKKEKEKKDIAPKTVTAKRKTRDDTNDKESKGPAKKLRKVSEPEIVPLDYVPPQDLPAKIADLSPERQGGANVVLKPLVHAIDAAVKKGDFILPKNMTAQAKAERLAIEIERAVHDTHPNFAQYGQQARSIGFNLKNNQDLCNRLLKITLAPTTLAVMTTDQMATKELQQETAEMKARAEKQSILITEDGPRVRRTHKGEEMIENESFVHNEDAPSVIRRPSVREPTAGLKHETGSQSEDQAEQAAHAPLHVDTEGAQQSPKHPNFDINKVFSSVKSPTAGHTRRPSAIVTQATGPGFDPDVDRLLQDENESPPYSPTDESDPDVIWRGSLAMNSVADLQATARWIGGSNAQTMIGVPWTTLIPKRMTVAGRIDEQKAIEYLCGLRFSDPTDIVVTALAPASEADKADFQALVDYFVSKKRYGVVGDKGVYNVRDTYLVPVPPGEGNFPEFMLNFSDNLIPQKRTQAMLLVVFVWRRDPTAAKHQTTASQSPVTSTPTPTLGGFAHRHASISGPAFSPASPQGPFPQPGFASSGNNGHLPASHPTQGQRQPAPPNVPPPSFTSALPSDTDRHQLQQQGQALAEEILGPLINSPTVQFLLPQAFQMIRKEWVVIRGIFEREPRARHDLTYLSHLLEKEGKSDAGSGRAANAHPNVSQQTVTPSA